MFNPFYILSAASLFMFLPISCLFLLLSFNLNQNYVSKYHLLRFPYYLLLTFNQKPKYSLPFLFTSIYFPIRHCSSSSVLLLFNITLCIASYFTYYSYFLMGITAFQPQFTNMVSRFLFLYANSQTTFPYNTVLQYYLYFTSCFIAGEMPKKYFRTMWITCDPSLKNKQTQARLSLVCRNLSKYTVSFEYTEAWRRQKWYYSFWNLG